MLSNLLQSSVYANGEVMSTNNGVDDLEVSVESGENSYFRNRTLS